MQFEDNVELKMLNTFGVNAKARFYSELHAKDDLKQIATIIDDNPKPLLFLGGGSNVLFTQDFDGYVVQVVSKGIRIVSESENECFVEATAGEVWDDLVRFCIHHNLYGLENLSGIPGTVGSSPIQNIGAYGVEVKECIHQVNAVRLDDFEELQLMNKDCLFGYRDSIFKGALKGKIFIDSVVFCLSKIAHFTLNYGCIADEIKRISPNITDLKAVSNAIVNIRNSKIPDPKLIGSAGSFFKNPMVDSHKLNQLISEFPNLIYYKITEQSFKLAAAWLIEQCGWKGFRKGNFGVNQLQPLILVNYGDASGQDILHLSHQMQQSVFTKFGIELHPEVNIL